jgi:hypothetical protein
MGLFKKKFGKAGGTLQNLATKNNHCSNEFMVKYNIHMCLKIVSLSLIVF